MNAFDLHEISERYMEIFNPSTPEKTLAIGEILGIGPDSRIIDFGCGSGELLALWAKRFGISGTGIDIHPYACNRAKAKMETHGLSGRIEVACRNAREYSLGEHSFDAALCIGATFIWGGYRQTIEAMKRAIRPGGKLVIGDEYRLKENIPQEYMSRAAPGGILNQYDLLQIAREEGFDFQYVVCASHDDWDRYTACRWHGTVKWLEENLDHPERQDVIDRLRGSQDDYFRYQRDYVGWAMYVLSPISDHKSV